jgi:5-(aminomethyl)-3-furanmethanol phosphate kinase
MNRGGAQPLWVVKLGGSIARASPGLLRVWLATLGRQRDRRVVIVPGGGEFADAVRRAQASMGFDDATAHRMALLAMDQSAAMYRGLEAALCVASTDADLATALAERGVAVWAPFGMADRATDVAADWTVTSDSLAAWLAHRIGADGLLLVKSCELPRPLPSAEALARAGVVDPSFPGHVRGAAWRWTCATASEPGDFAALTATSRPAG